MKFFILFSAVLIAANAMSASTNWLLYKKQYGKLYTSKKEEQLHLKTYNSNLRKIKEHNERYYRGLETYEMGVNEYTDWTTDDYSSFLKLSSVKLLGLSLNSTAYKAPLVKVDQSVDWREKGAVTPVEHQGNCGSCWAFSTTGALEAQNKIINDDLISLSKQNLVDCTLGFGNKGCNGGILDVTFQFMADYGVASASEYPYRGVQGRCHQFNPVVKARGYKNIGQNDEEMLQQAVATVGPVSVAIYASQNLMSYRSGVFKDRSCSRGPLNHAVLVVGYTPDYWIVKNSWGKRWGEEGYIKMKRGLNICGIAADASFPVL